VAFPYLSIALPQSGSEFRLQLAKFAQLCPHRNEFSAKSVADCSAGPQWVRTEGQQFADFPERKPERLHPANEPDRGGIFGLVNAKSAGAAGRRR
jgi:hypothetical protein